MDTLAIFFSENRFDRSEKVLLSKGPRSGSISSELTNRMRRLFKQQPSTSYSIDYGTFKNLINKINDPHQVDPKGQSVGLAIIPGKTSPTGNFNIALEAIRYKRPIPNEPISSFSLLEDSEYFGLLSTDFNIEYKSTDDRINIVGKAIAHTDSLSSPYNTLIILVEMLELIRMIDTLIPGLPVRFVFGRDIFSFRLETILIGDIIHDRLESRLFLDQHDLIPPPPDEDEKDTSAILNYIPEAYHQHFGIK